MYLIGCLSRASLSPNEPVPVCSQAMDAGEYNYAIAFQERIKISDEKMEFYKVRGS